nr:AbrB/MazE/SpoVT family DNA-binding domain-containing protein [uncultured Anaerocolumna sp.]
MAKGITRRIDDLGRIVIPKEMRRILKIKEGDPIDIYLKDGVICMESMKLQCVCCENDNEDKLVVVDGVHMCPDCLQKFFKEARK